MHRDDGALEERGEDGEGVGAHVEAMDEARVGVFPGHALVHGDRPMFSRARTRILFSMTWDILSARGRSKIVMQFMNKRMCTVELRRAQTGPLFAVLHARRRIENAAHESAYG